MTELELLEAVEKLVDYTRGFEQDTLKRIGESLKATGRLSQSDAQALRNIYSITGDMQEITKQLADITDKTVAEINALYDRYMTDEVSANKALYDFRNYKYVPYAENTVLKSAVRKWVEYTAGELKNLNRTKAIGFTQKDLYGNVVGFTPLDEAWQQAIDKVVVSVASGGNFEDEVRQLIQDLGGSGVKFQYESGRQVRLDSIVRQNIIYGAKQAQQGYQEDLEKELECDVFYVTHSYTCRESHRFMDCGQFSYGKAFTDDRGEYYPDGSEALARLNDYNCNHNRRGGIAGVSENPYSTAEKNELHKKLFGNVEYNGVKKTRSEWIQYQRGIERAIREEQDKKVLAKAAGIKDVEDKANLRIKMLKAKYKDFCTKVDLTPTPGRYN